MSKNLQEIIKESLTTYFSNLEGEKTSNLYELVLEQIEAPLLEIVMQNTKGNQSKAATYLGLSRGTLRKLLSKYNLLN